MMYYTKIADVKLQGSSSNILNQSSSDALSIKPRKFF